MPNTYPHLVDRLVLLQQHAAGSHGASLYAIFEDTMQVGCLPFLRGTVSCGPSAWPQSTADIRLSENQRPLVPCTSWVFNCCAVWSRVPTLTGTGELTAVMFRLAGAGGCAAGSVKEPRGDRPVSRAAAAAAQRGLVAADQSGGMQSPVVATAPSVGTALLSTFGTLS